nr:MAG TPA: Protein of unknown function (DUF3095) [Caudoviricetes sp.]
MTSLCPWFRFGGPGASLCLPAGGAAALRRAAWGRGRYPHMGGALKGTQIDLDGLSRAGARG